MDSKLFPFLLLILLGFHGVSSYSGNHKTNQESNIKKYKINLDDPPELRWVTVGKHYQDFNKDFLAVIEEYVPKALIPYVEKTVEKFINRFDPEFVAELRGYANATNANLGELITANIIYDVTAHCTSIVAQDSKGVIWHGRNLDYPFTKILRNITFHAQFVSKGKVVYEGVTMAGYVGLLTGLRPGVFSVSLNERYLGNMFSLLWNALVAIFDSRSSVIGMAIRKTLASAENFSQAVDALKDHDVVAPAYYILAGTRPGEGAVISHDRLTSDDVWYLDKTKNRWFLVETNFDHWKPPSDPRQIKANELMMKLGPSNLNETSLLDVISTSPVLNSGTVFSSIMNPSTSYFFTHVWNQTASGGEI